MLTSCKQKPIPLQSLFSSSLDITTLICNQNFSANFIPVINLKKLTEKSTLPYYLKLLLTQYSMDISNIYIFMGIIQVILTKLHFKNA